MTTAARITALESRITRLEAALAYVDDPQVRHVIDTVAAEIRVMPAAIRSHTRCEPVAWARALCMFILRVDRGLSVSHCARPFHRVPATVFKAVRRVQDAISVDPASAATLSSIRSKLQAPSTL